MTSFNANADNTPGAAGMEIVAHTLPDGNALCLTDVAEIPFGFGNDDDAAEEEHHHHSSNQTKSFFNKGNTRYYSGQ
eukprot:scaffold2744_cov141-Skeletonema_menzelii.AAC.2